MNLCQTNLWSVCWTPLNIQQLLALFSPYFFFFFSFSPFWKIVFATEPYFLPLLKETQGFFRTFPQVQTSPRPLLVLIFFRSTFQHGSQAQARSRELKGKGHQGSQKCSHTLSRGTWEGRTKPLSTDKAKKCCTHTHGHERRGREGEKKEKNKEHQKKRLFFVLFFFCCLFCCLAGFVFKAQLWVWSITSCCVLNKVTLCAVWIREGGTERQQLAALLIQ